MKVVQYNGEIWDGPAVHPDLWNLLLQKDLLIELSSGLPPFQVVLGVPHHAAPGIDRIADDWINPKTGQPGRAADETTGLTGLAVFRLLSEKGFSCKLVIAAHPTDHDPNKTPGCPYWNSVFSAPKPGLLFELHGAGKHRKHALELSAGQNQVTDVLAFGKTLAYYLDGDSLLAVQIQPGSSDASLFKNRQKTGGRLQNPALETLSLAQAGQEGIPALHLEMKYMYRQPDPAYPASPQPSQIAWDLSRALATTLDAFVRQEEIHISAADLSLQPGLPEVNHPGAFLTRPALEYEESFMAACLGADFGELNDNPDLRVWRHEDFTGLVHSIQRVVYHGLPGDPPEEYLWLIDQGEFIGRVLILHWLNDFRLRTDGQVDYWIRDSKRRQGYGRLILRLALERFRQLGLDKILISCRTDNTGSRKIIEANGGVLESEIVTPDGLGYPRPRLRYWIQLK